MQRHEKYLCLSLIDAKLRFKKELVGGVIGAIARYRHNRDDNRNDKLWKLSSVTPNG